MSINGNRSRENADWQQAAAWFSACFRQQSTAPVPAKLLFGRAFSVRTRGRHSIHLIVMNAWIHTAGKRIHISRLWMVYIRPFADAPAFFNRYPAVRFSFYPCTLRAWYTAPKSGSRQLLGSCLQHRTSSDIDDGAEISVRELHAFLLTRDTHRCKESSNARPQCHLQLCDVSVHFHRRGDPLPSFHLDLVKRAPQLIPEIFGFWKWMQIFRPWGEDLPGARRTCGRHATCASV